MSLYSLGNSPDQNMAILAGNPYPGRVLIMGFVDNVAVQAYAIGGRSEDSRNRVLTLEDNIISTESFDKSLPVSRPELTIYDAMRRTGSLHIVTNGDQTATALQYSRSGLSFENAMNSRNYESDSPNFTSRISGYIDIMPDQDKSKFAMSIISKDPGSDQAVRRYYTDNSPEIQLVSGVGYGLHTYRGDDDPLMSFNDPPFRVPILNDAKAMAELLWGNLNPETRVSTAVKTIAANGQVYFHIINLHTA